MSGYVQWFTEILYLVAIAMAVLSLWKARRAERKFNKALAEIDKLSEKMKKDFTKFLAFQYRERIIRKMDPIK
jgi:hypothetical protein